MEKKDQDHNHCHEQFYYDASKQELCEISRFIKNAGNNINYKVQHYKINETEWPKLAAEVQKFDKTPR